jgi:hypothetical protein
MGEAKNFSDRTGLSKRSSKTKKRALILYRDKGTLMVPPAYKLAVYSVDGQRQPRASTRLQEL